ncbi:MAG TPA: hypothetical protein VFQ45_06430 [Longimicrobium sp.]|nr:hypothetical protein [Longimicrobium sp.]
MSDTPDPTPLHETAHEPAGRPWELELLISGAVVFSLMQLPGMVDRAFDRAVPHYAGNALLAMFSLYMYGKLVLYTLIASFLVHLVGRAYWVGLIGLDRVFPGGVKWDNATYGPVMREVYSRRMVGVQARIDSADRFCSVLFSFAFTIALLFIFSTVALGMAAGLAFGVSRLFLGGRHASRVFWIVMAAAALIPVGTWLVDRAVGGRLRAGGGPRRGLSLMATVSYYLNAMPLYGTVAMVLFSNFRKRAFYPVFYLSLALLFTVFIVRDVYLRQGILRTGDYGFLPDNAGQFGVRASYYDSQRDPGDVPDELPSIQADIVRDPYVRLFIPYSPRRHGRAFAEQCQGVRPLAEPGIHRGENDPPDTTRVDAVLECWTRLQPVSLNGRPLRPAFRFYRHPVTGLRGVVAYIPTTGLPRGENLLTVGPAPRARAGRDAGDSRRRDRTPHYIRFWL